MTKSARGLFRATGGKAKPVHQRDLLTGEIEKIECLEREKNEFYPTPPEPTRSFINAEIDRLRQFDVIWECAAGDGAMAREFEGVGLKVFKSDLIDRGCGAAIEDFYECDTPRGEFAIVSNPPFDLCHGDAPFVRRALDDLNTKYLAFLLPFNWLGSKSKSKLWADHPPSRVYLMRWRIDFTGQGAPPMLNAWFVWDVKHKGETVLRMLDKNSNSAQGELI